MGYFFSLQTVPTSFIRCDFDFIFNFFNEVTRPGQGCIIKVRRNFRNIDSLTYFSSNMLATYVTFECCFICIFLSVMFSFGAFFVLPVEAKSVNLVVSLPK